MRPQPATIDWDHYRSDDEPRSSGRVLLSHALLTHLVLGHGLSGDNVADAFGPDGSERERRWVTNAIKLFQVPLQDGRFRTWARPFGGGAAELLTPAHWEIDDFTPRFARSALNFARPFDVDAEPTHWIFVEALVIDALHDLHRDEVGMPRRHRSPPRASATGVDPDQERHPDAVCAEGAPELGALLPLAEVERLVGIKKSTIYQRIEKGRFPAPVRNGERLSSWREEEIRAWLRNPR